jgi:hypothetical protein
VQDGVFYVTRFTSKLIPTFEFSGIFGALLSETMMRQTRLPFPAEQLWLFELVQTA